MPRFFTDEIFDSTAKITGDDAKHITKVLRCKIGERITLCNKSGTDYDCEIISLGEEVLLSVIDKHQSLTEPGIKLTLYQALPKLDKMELIIQKAVELGTTRIVPVMTERCVSRPSKEAMAKKLERWQKISLSAAKQSGRGIVPQIAELLSFEEALEKAKADEKAILFYEKGGEALNKMISTDTKSTSIIIGSEGGFSEREVTLAEEKGIKTATLGARILRCETAPLAAISIIMNLSGNM